MTTKLRIAPELVLPVDAVTQTIGILAKRRVGKSYTARRFAEQFLEAGQQVVIVDPKGDWWGIRSSADGKAPGLPVVILGGERGDVPLEVGGGEIVAKLVVEERVSVVLDLSLFRKREVAVFMTAFLENLYRLKAKEVNRTPLMLIVDEADAIMPQKPQPEEARMLGAGEDIVRRGGQRGIGCMLITQRSAVLNKNVLTQSKTVEKVVRDEAAIEKAVLRAVAEERRRFKPLLTTLRGISRGLGKARTDIVQHDESLITAGSELARLLDTPDAALSAAVFVHDNVLPARTVERTVPAKWEASAAAEPSGDLSRPQQKILNVLASLDAIGLATPKRSNVGVLSGVSSTSSGFERNLSVLRTAGYIEYPSSGLLKLTREGKAVAVPDTDYSTLRELHDAWCSKVSGPQADMLRVLIPLYPKATTREDLAAEVNVSATSSGFERNLSVLRSLGVIDYPRPGEVVATDMLFPEGLS